MSQFDDYPRAFPNCEQIMLDAFNRSDPVPAVLVLIPSDQTLEEVTIAYIKAVKTAPTRANHLALALSNICESPDAPLIYNKYTVSECINERLADFHSEGFLFAALLKDKRNSFDQGAKIYGPANEYLINSLLSGFSLKYDLVDCKGQQRAIADGLGPSDDGFGVSANVDPLLCQLQVVGACIQLLTYGSGIVTNKPAECLQPIGDIATKLKSQKAAGAVTDPDALKILELAILHAESGFKEENDIDNVWDMLFPLQPSASSNTS